MKSVLKMLNIFYMPTEHLDLVTMKFSFLNTFFNQSYLLIDYCHTVVSYKQVYLSYNKPIHHH